MRAGVRLVLVAAVLVAGWRLAAPATAETPATAAFPGCSDVPFLVSPGPAGPEFVEEARTAFRRLSAVTGLDFTFAGTTDEVPSLGYLRDGSAPVIVGWAFPGQTDLLLPGASGGASVAVDTRSGRSSSGAVALNADHRGLYAPGFGPGMTSGSLLLHELGHLAGLGHSDDQGSLMAGHVSADGPGGFSVADRAALARLYSRC